MQLSSTSGVAAAFSTASGASWPFWVIAQGDATGARQCPLAGSAARRPAPVLSYSTHLAQSVSLPLFHSHDPHDLRLMTSSLLAFPCHGHVRPFMSGIIGMPGSCRHSPSYLPLSSQGIRLKVGRLRTVMSGLMLMSGPFMPSDVSVIRSWPGMSGSSSWMAATVSLDRPMAPHLSKSIFCFAKHCRYAMF